MMTISFTDPITQYLGIWAGEINIFSILLRIALAFIFAAILGCERAHKRHSAGLRTFILVVMGSTMAILLDMYCGQVLGVQSLLLSASTLIGIALISGNSFNYSSKSQLKGLTTAVALWASCFLGLLIGAGLYTVAAVFFVTMLLCLSVLPSVEMYLKDRSNHFEIHLELKQRENLKDFITTIRRLGLRIDDIEHNPAYANSGLSVFSISITVAREELKKYKQHSEIIDALRTLDYISHVEEIV